MRLGDHGDDLGKQGFAADFFRLHDEGAGLVDGRADDVITGLFGDRDWLAGDHGFIDVATAFRDGAVYGDFFAGADSEEVAFLELLDGDFFFLAVGEAVGGFCGESEQGLDCLAGAAAGAGFQQLSEENEHGDDGGGFEVEADLAIHAEGCGENLGHQDGHGAVEPCRADTDHDEGEHVQAAGGDGAPAFHEKDAARPKYDGGGEGELDPFRDGAREPGMYVEAGNHAPHGDEQDGKGEGGSDPEFPTQ